MDGWMDGWFERIHVRVFSCADLGSEEGHAEGVVQQGGQRAPVHDPRMPGEEAAQPFVRQFVYGLRVMDGVGDDQFSRFVPINLETEAHSYTQIYTQSLIPRVRHDAPVPPVSEEAQVLNLLLP